MSIRASPSLLSAATGCPLKFKHLNHMCYGAIENTVSTDPCKSVVGGDLATWHDEDTLKYISSLKWESR